MLKEKKVRSDKILFGLKTKLLSISTALVAYTIALNGVGNQTCLMQIQTLSSKTCKSHNTVMLCCETKQAHLGRR